MRRDPNKKSGAPVILAGLGGFLLGAATILFVLWIYTTQTRTQSVPAAPPPASAQTTETPQASPPQASPQPGRETPAPSPLPVIPVGPPAAAPPGPSASMLPGDLASHNLLLPVQGIRPAQLQDTFGDTRGGGERHHEALDILAPRGTPVLATEDGKVAKLFTSKLGGLTIYQFDPTATYAYYYAHLDRYADGLKEGDTLRRGQVIAYVGSTGDADAASPHLHFTIFRLTPEKQWWKGDPINPFGLLR